MHLVVINCSQLEAFSSSFFLGREDPKAKEKEKNEKTITEFA